MDHQLHHQELLPMEFLSVQESLRMETQVGRGNNLMNWLFSHLPLDLCHVYCHICFKAFLKGDKSMAIDMAYQSKCFFLRVGCGGLGKPMWEKKTIQKVTLSPSEGGGSTPVTFLAQIYQVPKTLGKWLGTLELLMLDHHPTPRIRLFVRWWRNFTRIIDTCIRIKDQDHCYVHHTNVKHTHMHQERVS